MPTSMRLGWRRGQTDNALRLLRWRFCLILRRRISRPACEAAVACDWSLFRCCRLQISTPLLERACCSAHGSQERSEAVLVNSAGLPR
jgi:hypothetical protein